MTYLPTAFEALEDLGPTSAVGLSRGPRATLVPPPSSQPSRSDRERLEVLLEAGPALSHARGAEGLEGILLSLIHI